MEDDGLTLEIRLPSCSSMLASSDGNTHMRLTCNCRTALLLKSRYVVTISAMRTVRRMRTAMTRNRRYSITARGLTKYRKGKKQQHLPQWLTKKSVQTIPIEAAALHFSKCYWWNYYWPEAQNFPQLKHLYICQREKEIDRNKTER